MWREEATTIKTLRKRMKRAEIIVKTLDPFKAGSVNPSQLVRIRRAHQTERAAKSVRPVMEGHKEAEGSTAGSQRRKICMQMADVIRRTGTGLERGSRWKSGGAPGTKDSAEASLLNGNSANAELAAGERVKAVRIKSYLWSVVLTMSHSVYGPSKEALCCGESLKIPGRWVGRHGIC